MEAWYVDHHTYVGVTAARLRVAPYNTPVPSNVRIAAALVNSYCLEATAGATTWSDRGPGGVPGRHALPLTSALLDTGTS